MWASTACKGLEGGIQGSVDEVWVSVGAGRKGFRGCSQRWLRILRRGSKGS